MKSEFQTESHPTAASADPSAAASGGWGGDAARLFAETELGQALVRMLEAGSPAQARFAEFVLRNPLAASARGIGDLAEAADVSAPTISRIARELGSEGFPAFRARLGQTVGALLDPVSKLREGKGRAGGAGVAAESIRAARGEIEGLAEPGTAARIAAVAARIAEAREVFVVGFGLSAHLAAMLALGLQPYRDRVVNAVQFGGTEIAAGRVTGIGEGDLVVAIAFPRYSGDILHLVRFARDRKARIVALTDSTASPLARYADDLLLAPAIHPVLPSSYVAGVAVVEALVAEFMMADPGSVERAEKLSAALEKYLHKGG
jgi:DNA-binding MurR/RpiR family transcriptional regulator